MLICWWLGIIIAYAAPPVAAVPDVRILIDVSGSMKKNDQHNLRMPATRLLLNLLPKHSRAGVWLFSDDTINLVPVGTVDAAWLSQADQAIKQIHSRGQYTNIGDGLETVARGWQGTDKKTSRVIIMLTDGIVDVSKNKETNRKARKLLLTDTILQLARRGIKVYVITLSRHADSQLAKQIAFATDGFTKQVMRADQLAKSFANVFVAAVQRDSVPIKGKGRFLIDAQTNEFTVMVFADKKSKVLQLQTPSKTVLTREQLPSNVKWHHDERYDLVTVTKPEQGRWQVITEQDDDNRVYIVSNLQLQATKVPNNVFLFEPILYQINLTEQGKIITEPGFLQAVKVQLRSVNAAKNSQEWVLHDNGVDGDSKAGDGIFTQRLIYQKRDMGAQELILTASSPTFQRDIHQLIQVHDAPIQVDHEESSDGVQHTLTLQENTALVNSQGLTIDAIITDSLGAHQQESVKKNAQGDFQLRVKIPAGEVHAVNFAVAGQTTNGRAFSLVMPAVMVKNEKPVKPVQQTVKEPPSLPAADAQQEELDDEFDMETKYESTRTESEKRAPQKAPENKTKPPINYSKLLVIISVVLLYLGLLAVTIKFLLQVLRKKRIAAIKDKLGR